MMDAQTAAGVAVYLDQYAAASEQAKTNTAAAMAVAWYGFDGWYSPTLAAELAEQSADLSRAGQQMIAGLAEQYVASVVALLRDEPVSVSPVELEPVRGGANLDSVYRRPVDAYRQKIATGGDQAEALNLAVLRRDGLATSDLLLAERSAQQQQMDAQQVTRFRRVIRPELSQTGTCGPCIAASDQVYSSRELMPIHAPSCKCKTMPIVGEADPGRSLNQEDLDRLYAEAGSTKAEDLRRTRYKVAPHGELGPQLTVAGHHHRGPAQVKPLEQDPPRAARMLEKVLPVLDTLEKRASAGEDVSGPLGYQRDLVDRLRRIVD